MFNYIFYYLFRLKLICTFVGKNLKAGFAETNVSDFTACQFQLKIDANYTYFYTVP